MLSMKHMHELFSGCNFCFKVLKVVRFARRRRKFFENVIQARTTETNMGWTMLAPQLMDKNGSPPPPRN